MSLTKQQFSEYIKNFKFRELFNDMGWNNDKTTLPIIIDNNTYTLQSVAEKSGFKILLCNPLSHGLIPDYSTRKKIETKVTKLFQEHVIIFFDAKKTVQIWQSVLRQTGKPTKVTETHWHSKQDPELLYQRASGIFFELDEEENITIVDVTKRITDNFSQNNEKITKQFYDRFKKEHSAFLQFIKGITDTASKEWYASLMLNRLMFCYFIQKKGFLDNNKNYLRDKLNACTLRQAQGKMGAKFYSFYRDFLLVLFHKGLNEPPVNGKRLSKIEIEIGKIPYLNGGLFDEHELEKQNTNIDIEDKAFERLFDFFDQYEWHLDTRHTASGKDINPDVIGYIFEKYINDRANMGAYYTKEDITDYISKNCIIPYLFDETFRNLKKNSGSGRLSEVETELWTMLKQSGDRYIYEAVKKGMDQPLPQEIEQGINDITKRNEWNTSAWLSAPNMALPTEIWREVVERRKRYTEVKSKIDKGDIQHINDFITYNLHIRQFTQDIIENTNDPELLKHFYDALNGVTIIDPTCGSGAFLFAAMNILEPLYEACLQRMEIFIEEAKDENNYKHLSPELQKSWKSLNHKQSSFRKTLAQVKSPEHPNLQYFIYKSIILRNLYGVDIMKEAVEIAKLRLFLKLVATVEADYRKPNLGLEPLPDIDFNIRAGNTLVGFATFDDAVRAINERDKPGQLGLVFDDELDIINTVRDKADDLAKAFASFKEAQLDENLADYKKAKDKVVQYQANLNDILNEYLAFGYGIDIQKKSHKKRFDEWLQSHQPFHWFGEFYEIIHVKGGFDVIIGNPPYVEYSAVKKFYTLKDFSTLKSGNLYALVIERCLEIMLDKSRIGMIIQMSAFCTPRMEDFQKIWFKKSKQSYISFFDDRPGKLFDGLEHIRVAICISEFGLSKNEFIGTTNYIKFKTEFRSVLFENLNYVLNNNSRKNTSILKVNNILEHSIIDKVWKSKEILAYYLTDKTSDNFVYYGYGYGYFGKILNYRSYFKGEHIQSSTGDKFIYVNNEYDRDIIVALMNSTLFYWFYVNYSDGHNFTRHVISSIPFTFPEKEISKKLKSLTSKLMKDLERNSNRKSAFYKATGLVEYDEYFPKKSKPIIDEIDKVLAVHYGFTDEELDFIINYDIKYRMGKELENEPEQD